MPIISSYTLALSKQYLFCLHILTMTFPHLQPPTETTIAAIQTHDKLRFCYFNFPNKLHHAKLQHMEIIFNRQREQQILHFY